MTNVFTKAMPVSELDDGGMKAIDLDCNEIVICNSEGKYYTIQRRYGHMNAPMDLGSLDGNYLTCPMHCVQSDITNGEALYGTVTPDISREILLRVTSKAAPCSEVRLKLNQSKLILQNQKKAGCSSLHSE